jgi:hypothetical protein
MIKKKRTAIKKVALDMLERQCPSQRCIIQPLLIQKTSHNMQNGVMDVSLRDSESVPALDMNDFQQEAAAAAEHKGAQSRRELSTSETKKADQKCS